MKGFAFARHARSQVLTAAISSLLTMSVVGVGAYATGLIPASDGTINGCYDRTNGNLRVVAATGDCRTAELPIQWSQRGPQGPSGAAGAQGPKGDQGATGPSGAIGTFDALAGLPCTFDGLTGQLSLRYDTAGRATLTCAVVRTTARLLVSAVGLGIGAGTVTGGPINCPPACSADVPIGTTVALEAHPAPGSGLVGWTGYAPCFGDIAPALTCNVLMNAPQTVNANFTALRLVVFIFGLGSVRSDALVNYPSGICANTISPCTASPVLAGTVITLTAQPYDSSAGHFDRWGGACAGIDPVCTFTFSESTQVSAGFLANAP